MFKPTPTPEDVHECAEELRSALAASGVTLPSLGVDLPSFAGSCAVPLVALGNCNLATARALLGVLNKAAGR